MTEIDSFINDCKESGSMSHNTLKSYKCDLDKLQSYVSELGITDVAKISEKVLKDHLDRLKEKGYSPSTIARNIVSIKALFKHLVKIERVTIDASENLVAPKVELPKANVLTRKQVEDLLGMPDVRTAKGQRDSAMLELMYATGIKVSELVTVKVSQLDMQIGNILCKNNKTERIIPFDKRTKAVLSRYLQDGRRHLINRTDEELLFINYKGEAMSRQGVWKLVKSYAQQADIKVPITPEALRHSFAAHLVERGADIEAVQMMMGHVSPVSTNRYARENRDYIRDVYDRTH
ncbi:tyrosine-type recombinase/integrase [Butyrivibrio sp. INlla16]|uniref:tyrosine-type recombinase/integrase n=1 Tax=Butyrivibrio sp. INlla16 TaxID=1520807 RepID=UPI0008809B05|nr:tyrosine-type recombinase/integrase [Butyrivibrio sp. INlla16]SDB49187.1 integrase/recombinase XerD [Butyrivibrio sp. INlla16]